MMKKLPLVCLGVGGVVEAVDAGLLEDQFDTEVGVFTRRHFSVQPDLVDGDEVGGGVAAAAGEAVREDDLVAGVQGDAYVTDLVGADALLGFVAPVGRCRPCGAPTRRRAL